MDDIGGDTTEDAQETLTERFLGNVSDRAKPCISKAIDYTLLVILLLLQFMQCSPATLDNLQEHVKDNKLNETSVSDFYSCNMSDSSLILYSSETYINVLVIMAISVGIIIGVLYGAFVWIHARRIEELPIHPWTEKLYKCTDKILIIDSAIEIPISFYMAPGMTVFLWSLFACCFVGSIFMLTIYSKSVEHDEQAITVFGTNLALVGLSLFKLTGEVSQYWVLYKSSVSQENREKFDEDQKRNVGLSSRLLNAVSVRNIEEDTPRKMDEENGSESDDRVNALKNDKDNGIEKKTNIVSSEENVGRNDKMV